MSIVEFNNVFKTNAEAYELLSQLDSVSEQTCLKWIDICDVISAALNTNNLIHWQDLESAFQNRIKTGSIINQGHIDLRNFLLDAKKMLIEKLHTTLKTEGSVKVSTTLKCKFENSTNNQRVEENKSFKTPTVDILLSRALENWFKEDVYNTILQKIEEFNEKDSGWSLSEVINLDVNISRFAPIHGGFSTFIPLPKDISEQVVS
ncbi:uncharacterized protein LOC123274342 [Cotesia glomerata]|uniref:uncharacterized protein LOC123274342 n=1 Tax=Cotesia glomerata TaxID=32391 RepID=UPI001D01D972|nr:uncharacterized protein LOC123274342 [Cotesia glomerata]